MSAASVAQAQSPQQLAARLDALKQQNDWRAAAAYAKQLPSPLTHEWCRAHAKLTPRRN